MRPTSQDMSASLSQLQSLYLGDQPSDPNHNFPSSNPQFQQQTPSGAAYPFSTTLTPEDLQALSGQTIPQSHQQQQSQPLSTPEELSVSPSATSLPINLQPPSEFKHRETFDWDSAHAFDFDSLDNFDYGSQGAYTPSYGSWSSEYGDAPPSFASFEGSSQGGGSVFSDPSSLNDPQQSTSAFASPPLPLSFQPDFSKYVDFRAMSLDQQQAQAGQERQQSSQIPRSASPAELMLGGMDLDGGGGGTGGGHVAHAHGWDKDKESTLTPSVYLPTKDATMKLGGGSSRGSGSSSGIDAAGRSTTVFSSTLSESPPTSTVDLPSLLTAEPIRQSPALAPLSIPTSAGPSLNLIQPTPHTARPVRKGKGTLELERALGELVSEESQRDQQQQPPFFSPNLDAKTPQAFANPALPIPYAYPNQQFGYPFQFGAIPPQLYPGYHLLPQQHLQNHTIPRRQRSKSETDIMSPATHFGNLLLPSNQHNSNTTQAPSQPPLPPLPNPNAHLQHPHAGGWPNFAPVDPALVPYRFNNLDLANTDEQRDHEGGPSRPSFLSRRPVGGVGTPGYQGGLAAPVGDDFPTPGHRRSRSHGSGNRPGVGGKLDGVALEFGNNFGGHLSPVPQHRLSPTPPPPSQFASPPPGGVMSGGSNPMNGVYSFQANSNLPPTSLGPLRTPYVYHSPAGSPGPTADDGGSETGESVEVAVESKTTTATIEAAMRRRNPNTNARFTCDLCGETFTRRYNLKGHQRAHRNEKPFACSFEGCEKAFARAHDCKRHELLHLGVRRYHCDPCARTFVRLDALQRHHRSEVGQACVQSLKEAGYVLGYDTSVPAGAAL